MIVLLVPKCHNLWRPVKGDARALAVRGGHFG
jgi:hypothetical protein